MTPRSQTLWSVLLPLACLVVGIVWVAVSAR